jgi:predicted metalloprotease with PDZ domain
VRTYTRDDVITALEAVQHHDWKALIDARIYAVRPTLEPTCLDGSGWTLAYGPEVGGSGDDDDALLDARKSFGCQFHDGRVSGIVPGSPADMAGLKDGSQVKKINGVEFTGKNLEAALRKAHDDGTGALTVTLILSDGKTESELPAKCLAGPLHPHLERGAGPDQLTDILRAR